MVCTIYTVGYEFQGIGKNRIPLNLRLNEANEIGHCLLCLPLLERSSTIIQLIQSAASQATASAKNTKHPNCNLTFHKGTVTE